MTYPQSGPNYGQSDSGQGQQYGAGQYGQPQYGATPQYGSDQYGSAPYGQQQQYGAGGQQYGTGAQQQYGSAQQYGQQQYGQQYGESPQYQAPKPPSQGLPANTGQILSLVVGALGVVMLFCGFLAGYKVDGEYISRSVKLFETGFVAPYSLFVVAGVLGLLTLLAGAGKQVVAGITALSLVAAIVTIFQFATNDGNGVGAILLMVFSILGTLAAAVWLLVECGQIKTAPAGAAASADSAAATSAAATSAASTSAAGAAGYSYGDQGASGQAPSGQAPSGQAPSGQAPYGQSSGAHAAPSYGDSSSSYGSGATGSSYGATPSYQPPADADATTFASSPSGSETSVLGGGGDGSETTVFGTADRADNSEGGQGSDSAK
ncbi:hypothetical protein C6V83_05065 [Gordonia iterans]|uniref:DUF5336 domain-containing protein n=1 Tax=Gordonia iterans TaxID=1004901 RepID=A0A2S0KDH0_9ACTN|nr:DUF5336 domain-containing protein [Gordonia iterans]AVL99737.1 hypothetical protein C6V83_05065 [Gordonia iterans]